MAQHEGGLHQRVLHQLLEQLGDQPSPTEPGLRLDAMFLDQPLQGWHVSLEQVLADHPADCLYHLDPRERTAEANLLALVLNRRGSPDPLDEVNDERFGELHHPLHVGVGLVQLQHRVLGAVPLIHSFIAEDPPDLVDPVEAADDQSLEVELQRDPQIQVHVERIVVGSKRPGRGPTRHRLQHGRLHLGKAPAPKERPGLFHQPAAREEDLHHLGVGNQVEVALPVAELLVLQPVIFLG